jgi:Cof subfamily protein (haloacid dehalogenase superfamily)
VIGRPPALVAIDVDGTLVDDTGDLTVRSIEAIGKLRAAGTQVVLATGRPFVIVDRTAAALGEVDYLICSNGALTVRRVDSLVLRDLWLDGDLPEMVVRSMRERLPGVGFAFELEKGVKSEIGLQQRLPSSIPLGRPVEDVLTLLPERGPVRKVLLFHDDHDDDIRPVVGLAQEVVGERATVTHSGLPYAEVGPFGLHKAVALADLCSNLGIAQSDVIAFGDDVNDVEMLEWAGTGVAMANAVPEALAVADVVTVSNNDDGVAHYLERVPHG